jgi:hypothetical protein
MGQSQVHVPLVNDLIKHDEYKTTEKTKTAISSSGETVSVKYEVWNIRYLKGVIPDPTPKLGLTGYKALSGVFLPGECLGLHLPGPIEYLSLYLG